MWNLSLLSGAYTAETLSGFQWAFLVGGSHFLFSHEQDVTQILLSVSEHRTQTEINFCDRHLEHAQPEINSKFSQTKAIVFLFF